MLTPRIDLKELATRESEQVEWKKSVADIDNVLKTITAFANDFQNLGGGYVVCGAEELKDEFGFQSVRCSGLDSSRFKELEGKIMADARGKIDPPVLPVMEEIQGEDPGKRVLIFIIPATGHAHSYRSSTKDASTYYVRIGRETIEARNGILRELLVRKKALPPWDRRINDDSNLESVDLLAFRQLLQEIGVWNNAAGIDEYFSEEARISELVPSFGVIPPLIKSTRLRNFTLLLFAKQPTLFFPGAFCKFSVYPGKDRSESSAERYDVTGPIISQARQLLELLKPQLYTAFDKNSPEPNAPKYPERALQEAVINAIVHRDYEIDEPTSVTAFSDRVEIRSPGSLPRTINKDKFLAGAASPSWRNQSLAYFFNKLQLAQAEGQGIPTILRTMKQLGSPVPLFELEDVTLTCILPAHPRHELMRHVAEIERLIVQQDLDAAESLLNPILQKNPGNSRLLDLFTQICSFQKRPEILADFVAKNNLRPDELPISTVYQLADLMLDSGVDHHKQIGRTWMNLVSTRQLEAEEVKKVALALRKVGDDEKAVQVINRYLARKEKGQNPSHVLFDIRARAKIDLAKKCMATARSPQIRGEFRRKAWEQTRQYLDEAHQDVVQALEIVDHPRERDYIEKDLDFVLKLKQQVERPPRRSTGNRRF